MPLSVNIRLDVVNADVQPTNPDLKLHIRSDGLVGVAYIDWQTFIAGGEATGFIAPPSGKGLKTSKTALRRAATQQEKESAEALGGHRQTGSGARPGYKGDGQVLDQGAIDNLEGSPGKFRIENKYSRGVHMTLKLSDLQKIRSECQGRETPVFDIQFKDKNTLRTLDNWVLIPRREWEKLAGQADDHR